MKKILQKIRNQKGETITEVLVASLIVALAFVMVVSLITASYRILKRTNLASQNYYKTRNQIEEGTSVTKSGTVVISQMVNSSSNAMTLNTSNGSVNVQESTYTSSDGSSQVIVSYTREGN